MAQCPTRGIILPAVTGYLRGREDGGERFWRVVVEKLDLARIGMDARVSFLPVVAHFGHPLGIPNRTDAAEGLMAIGVNHFVLDDFQPRRGINDRLGDLPLPLPLDVHQGHAATRLHPADPVGSDGGPRELIKIADDVALDHAAHRPPPIRGNMPQHGLQPLENVVGLVTRKIGVNKEVAGTNVLDGTRLGLGFVRLPRSLGMHLACMARHDEAKKSDDDHGPEPARATHPRQIHLAPLGQPPSAFDQEGIATWNTEEKPSCVFVVAQTDGMTSGNIGWRRRASKPDPFGDTRFQTKGRVLGTPPSTSSKGGLKEKTR